MDTTNHTSGEATEVLSTLSDDLQPVTYTVLNTESDVWVKFASLPAAEVCAALMTVQFQWSQKRGAWHRSSPLERQEVIAAIDGATRAAAMQQWQD